MNEGILQISKDMVRVDSTTFKWFVKSLGPHRSIKQANGTAHYSDDYMVAAELDAELPIYYIRTKKSKGAK